MAPSRRRNSRRPTRYVFGLIAILCLGLYVYDYADRVIYQAYQSWLFDLSPDERGSGPEAVSTTDWSPRILPDAPGPALGTVQTEEPITAVLSHDTAAKQMQLPRTMIGRLSIPRLNISAMVREGADEQTLRRAVGHIPATAMPGDIGNVGMAGHRDTFFRNLRNVQPKDNIYLSTPDSRFTYRVESLAIVEPAQVDVLSASLERELTLVTCYPFNYIGNAPKRFIVRAKQLSATME